MQASPDAQVAVFLPDESATARLAEDVAAIFRAGDLVALSGDLGAGKTSFARALIRAVGGDGTLEVPSPTFPIRIDHDLPRMKVVHIDLYRLGEADDLDEIGLEEALLEAGVLVEWPELLHGSMASENRLDVSLAINGAGRDARLTPTTKWRDRLARTTEVRAFLGRCGWEDACRIPLAGDASSRAYERVQLGERQAILMNAPARPKGPPSYAGQSYDAVAHRARNVRAFIAIDHALREAGVRAPEIYATDAEAGLLLLEDLGSESLVSQDGAPLMERYEAAIDLLVHIHDRVWLESIAMPGGGTYRVPPYDRDALLVEISLFPDWFGGYGGEPAFPAEHRAAFLDGWSQLLDTIETGPRTLVLRDYHSPNILWQPDASGTDRVGVLDFQDGLLGHPAYDVASLAQDARVPLSAEQEDHLKSRYIAGRRTRDPGFDAAAFDVAFAILGAQRATKVLGAFTRLALVDAKPGYQRHRARLKALLRRTLSHPVLSGLRVWYEPYL